QRGSAMSGMNSILMPEFGGFSAGSGAASSAKDLAGVSVHAAGQAGALGTNIANDMSAAAPLVAATVAMGPAHRVATGPTPGDYQSRGQAALAKAEPQSGGGSGGGGGGGSGSGINGLLGIM